MKKLISIVLCICMVIAVGCAMTGCGNDEVLQRLDDLQETLQTQNGKIEELQTELQTQNGKIDELQTQNSQLTEKLGEMQTVIEEQAKEIGKLKHKVANNKFYSLQEAYDYGYLTKKNLENIAYYNNNLLPYPETADETVAECIKEDAANQLRNMESGQILDAKAENIEIVKYYGTYNGSYVILLYSPYIFYPDIIIDEWVIIGGVEFHDRGPNKIIVWKEKI